ncbi:MAG: hypothetical protein HY897_04350 [Deltaproteobacteria bacterium]|nr:hypothetical protein [Deltaproteobacteria bacterium]
MKVLERSGVGGPLGTLTAAVLAAGAFASVWPSACSDGSLPRDDEVQADATSDTGGNLSEDTGGDSVGDAGFGDDSGNGDSGIDAGQTPGLVVEVHDTSRAFRGTTLLAESYTSRVIEVDMDGNVVWEWKVPQEYLGPRQGPPEADMLPNGNVQVLLSSFGIVEVSRGQDGGADGEVVWSAEIAPIDHDADRLASGNVIFVFGMNDLLGDTVVTEIAPDGKVVWEWAASAAYGAEFPDTGPDWAHVNAVERLDNGDTLISPRDFYLTTIVNSEGHVVREYRYGLFGAATDPHEPNLLPDGNLLVCLQKDAPYQAVEIVASAGTDVDPARDVVWAYRHPTPFRTARDCDRLPNGNTLIVGVQRTSAAPDSMDEESTMIEVTPEGDVVWQLTLRGVEAAGTPGYFYKAQRLGNGAVPAD